MLGGGLPQPAKVVEPPLPSSKEVEELPPPLEIPSPPEENQPSAAEPVDVEPMHLDSDDVEEGAKISCPVCTLLNHPSLLTCEMCNSELRPVTVEPLVTYGAS